MSGGRQGRLADTPAQLYIDASQPLDQVVDAILAQAPEHAPAERLG